MSRIIYWIPRLHCMGPPHIYSRDRHRHSSILHIHHYNHRYPNWHESLQLTSNTAWRNRDPPNTMSPSSHKSTVPFSTPPPPPWQLLAEDSIAIKLLCITYMFKLGKLRQTQKITCPDICRRK